EPLGVQMHLVNNGREALTYLQQLAKDCQTSITEKVGLLISDIEMPEMDGYTLTAEVKADPKLRKLHVILHTSLSGVFNQQMVQKVGAEDFIAKFNPDELAQSVQKWLHTD
ncbi:MAG: chemotaxis protein CheW, partial [Alishewanella sp. 32-51-5]